jgi:hypothetical protein
MPLDKPPINGDHDLTNTAAQTRLAADIGGTFTDIVL